MLRILVERIRIISRQLVGAWGQKYAGLALGIIAAGFASTVLSGPMPPATERVFLGNSLDMPLAVNANPDAVNTLNVLRQKAARQGAARVIVGVRAAFAPEGLMSASNVALQRNEIAAAHSAVLDKIPSLKKKPEKIKRFEFIPFMAIEADSSELEALASLPEITSIEEDRLAKPTLSQSVPLIGGTTAWGSGYTGAGQAVAILDTGVDNTHAFLTGKVVSEACYSTNYAPHGATTVCPGGITASTAAGSAMPYAGTCPAGECDHGTHVAGIAAGAGVSYSGIAKDASLIAIQVFSRFDAASCSPSPCVMSYDSDQIKGLERVYALRNTYNIAAVNMSLGGGQYYNQSSCDSANPFTKTAIDNLRSANIATVISSGNSGYSDSMGAPGCISSAISVGATWDTSGWTCGGNPTSVDLVACYSNSVSFLNLLAPGSAITSSIPGGGYATWHGTSMAAPHVTGAWALLKQKNAAMTVTEGLNALSSTGVAVNDARNSIVKPRIQVDAALGAIAPSCSYSLSSSSLSISAAATIGSINVTAGSGCAWAAVSNAAWIAVTSGASGNGNGPVGYSIAANTNFGPRSGAMTIAGLTFTVTQTGTGSNVALASAGAIASASSSYSSAYPVAAINNNQRTGAPWGGGGGWNDATGNAYPDWVQIVFNGPKTIDRVVVYTVQNNYASPVEPTDAMTFSLYGITSFTVQGWSGSAWVTLGTVTGNNLVKRTVNFSAYTTDRIRVNVTGALASYSRIVEVEAWGGAAAAPVPSCTISPTAPSVITGATAQLFTATCSNSPTSYAWTVDSIATGSSASTYTTVSNLALGPHAVAVTASNGAGAGNPASTTLTVSPPPLSACSAITPASQTVVVNTATTQLGATCNNSPTSYVWKLDNGVVAGVTGPTYTVPPFATTAGSPHTVTVTANNAGGAGTVAATAMVTVTTQPIPSCTISPATPGVITGATAQLFTATCSNSPTSYAWTVDSIATGSSASTYTTASNLALGPHTVSVIATNAGGSSAAVNATLTVASNASTNVALASAGAIASASSSYSSAYPVAAINNNQRTGAPWGGGGGWNDATGNAYPDWAQIVFNGSKTIDRVVVYTVQNNYASPVEPTDAMTFSLYGVTSFTVQGWSGSAWVTLGTVTGNNLVKRTVNFSAYTTDRIRVNVTGALASYSRIVEVEAWGVGSVSDTTAPSIPTGLTATAASSSKINLSWVASTDAVGVTAYKVYRGASLIATPGNVTSYSDSGLAASTLYSYTVTACDAASNCSAKSTPASAKTLTSSKVATLR